MDAGLLPQGLNDVTLSHPTPTHHDQIGAAPDEVSGSQLFDLLTVKGLGIELPVEAFQGFVLDRKSTRLNSSHRCISYAVFCLKKKKTTTRDVSDISTTMYRQKQP